MVFTGTVIDVVIVLADQHFHLHLAVRRSCYSAGVARAHSTSQSLPAQFVGVIRVSVVPRLTVVILVRVVRCRWPFGRQNERPSRGAGVRSWRHLRHSARQTARQLREHPIASLMPAICEDACPAGRAFPDSAIFARTSAFSARRFFLPLRHMGDSKGTSRACRRLKRFLNQKL
jgi:hypothetical protein